MSDTGTSWCRATFLAAALGSKRLLSCPFIPPPFQALFVALIQRFGDWECPCYITLYNFCQFRPVGAGFGPSTRTDYGSVRGFASTTFMSAQLSPIFTSTTIGTVNL